MRKIRRLKKKRLGLILTLVILIISLIIITSLYIANKQVRDWMDMNLFRKNLSEKDTQFIALSPDKNNQVHVYSGNIAILNDKSVTLYNSYGEKITTIQTNINSAIFDSSNNYFAIAEKDGNEICLILEKTYLWSQTTEGKILQIHVNQNGYVAIVTTDVLNKSILTLYNSEGKKLFTRYFASTRIVDASISKDNKYIVVGEIDTSGTIIQSNIKIISVQNAQKNPADTIIYTYNAEPGRLISNVEYQDRGQLVCLYNNGISIIKGDFNKELLKIENENITFIANQLKNNAVYIEEESTGFFKSCSNIYILGTNDNQKIVYKLDEIAKEIYTKANIIVINAGTELYFINTSGWLIKKYTANQEITNVQFSESLATVVYKDKVVIINL